jgi:predicted PurR-regulated permease PerM
MIWIIATVVLAVFAVIAMLLVEGFQKIGKDLQKENDKLKDEVDELKKQLHDEFVRNDKPIQRMKAYLASAEPVLFAIGKSDTPGSYVVWSHFRDFNTNVIVKVFNTDDPDYNLGLAEELKEKLEEKI